MTERPAPEAGRLGQRARIALDLALGVVLAGLAELAIETWIEYLSHPGLSIIEAYQRGREPWTSIGLGAVVGGATLALLIAVSVALVEGSWIRRLLALACVGLGVGWWLVALALIPYEAFDGPQPLTFAFGWPRETALALLLPTVVAALVVFTPRRERPMSRMAPVHPEDDQA